MIVQTWIVTYVRRLPHHHIHFSDWSEASMSRQNFLVSKRFKVDIDEIERVTDAAQLKQLYMTASWIILQ